jgi:hypothetical protein
MSRRSLGLIFLAACLLAVSTAVPVVNGATSSYLTVGITQSAIKQSTVNGFTGVLVNYTSTFSTSIGTFVYLDLANLGGQTVYWNVGTCTFAANQKVQCFVPIAPTVAKGTYTASVFVTTNSNIPISTTTSLQLTL